MLLCPEIWLIFSCTSHTCPLICSSLGVLCLFDLISESLHAPSSHLKSACHQHILHLWCVIISDYMHISQHHSFFQFKNSGVTTLNIKLISALWSSGGYGELDKINAYNYFKRDCSYLFNFSTFCLPSPCVQWKPAKIPVLTGFVKQVPIPDKCHNVSHGKTFNYCQSYQERIKNSAPD